MLDFTQIAVLRAPVRGFLCRTHRDRSQAKSQRISREQVIPEVQVLLALQPDKRFAVDKLGGITVFFTSDTAGSKAVGGSWNAH
jgi:hypothetical protein